MFYDNKNIKKEQIIEILSSDKYDDELFKCANQIRKGFKGEEIHLRGLIEFSNYCKNDCLYCGIRKSNKNITRYRMTPQMIIETAKKAIDIGYKTVVLQGGEDPFFKTEILENIIKEIKKNDTVITLSIGERSFDDYKKLKESGADRFLLRIETTDIDLYEKLDPDMSWQKRFKALKDLKKAGFEVGTGSLVGLPNQNIESIANDILFFKEIDADMVGIGPFIPDLNTPLKNEKAGSFQLTLKALAIIRILMPDINIPATTALETLKWEGRFLALECGANVIMPNVTPKEFSQYYKLYPKKETANEDIKIYRENLIEKLNKMGRFVSSSYGYRK